MRIASRSEYGVRALLDLALRYGEGPVQSREIHLRQGVDEHYLNQILIVLRKAGLVESQRGPQGGHRLARPPEQITLLEALVALEGPLLAVEGNSSSGDVLDGEVVRGVWAAARQALERELGQLTLADLVARRQQRDANGMYYI